MQDLNDAVERFEPVPDERGEWKAVVRDARRRRRPVLLGSFAGVAMAAAALFALVLFEPWAGEHRTLLERALAAVDDGPVIHAVLRGNWGGVNVHLETGEQVSVHGENELWYDTARQRVRWVSRYGDAVLEDRLLEPERVDRDVLALGRDYRAALRSGSARVAGEDVIDGEPVTWITIHSERLPDSSDGKLHEFTQQVAVSNETYKPVATRDMRDRRPGSGNFRRVIELETRGVDEVDFSPEPARTMEGSFKAGRDPIPVEKARQSLGVTPLWLGPEFEGLRLSRVDETWLQKGKEEDTRITGPEAEEILRCVRERVRGCRGSWRERRGFRIEGDKVYETGVVHWDERQLGVSFAYGEIEDPFVMTTAKPFVMLSEARDRSALMRGATYFPPDGYVALAAGNHSGSLVVDGVHVVIHASGRELILSAARALKPMD